MQHVCTTHSIYWRTSFTIVPCIEKNKSHSDFPLPQPTLLRNNSSPLQFVKNSSAMENNKSTAAFARKLFFPSQSQSQSPSATHSPPSANYSATLPKLRFNDWNNRLLSYPSDHDYLSHILQLSPNEDCPIKVVDAVNSSLFSDQGKKFCPGYIRFNDGTTTAPWYSPVRILGSQSLSPHWTLVDLYGNDLDILKSQADIRAAWGVTIKSPLSNDDDNTTNFNDEDDQFHDALSPSDDYKNSSEFLDEHRNNHPEEYLSTNSTNSNNSACVGGEHEHKNNLMIEESNDNATIVFGDDDYQTTENNNYNCVEKHEYDNVMVEESNVNIFSQFEVLVNAASTQSQLSQPTSQDNTHSQELNSSIANDESILQQIVRNISAQGVDPCEVSSLFGRQGYVPRYSNNTNNPTNNKNPDPFIHHNGFTYRASTKNKRYLCARYSHPFMDNEWLTYSQMRKMIQYANNNLDPNIARLQLTKTCPAVLEVKKDPHGNLNSVLTTPHICDLQPVIQQTSLPDNENVSIINDDFIYEENPTLNDVELNESTSNDRNEITHHNTEGGGVQESLSLTTDATTDYLSTLSQVQSVINFRPDTTHHLFNHSGLSQYINDLEASQDNWRDLPNNNSFASSTIPIVLEVTSTHPFLQWYISTVLHLHPTKTKVTLSVMKQQVLEMDFDGTQNTESTKNYMQLKTNYLSVIIAYHPVELVYSLPFMKGTIQNYFLRSNDMVILPPKSSILISPKMSGTIVNWSYVVHLSFYEPSENPFNNVSNDFIQSYSSSYLFIVSYSFVEFHQFFTSIMSRNLRMKVFVHRVKCPILLRQKNLDSILVMTFLDILLHHHPHHHCHHQTNSPIVFN